MGYPGLQMGHCGLQMGHVGRLSGSSGLSWASCWPSWAPNGLYSPRRYTKSRKSWTKDPRRVVSYVSVWCLLCPLCVHLASSPPLCVLLAFLCPFCIHLVSSPVCLFGVCFVPPVSVWRRSLCVCLALKGLNEDLKSLGKVLKILNNAQKNLTKAFLTRS